MGMSIPEFWWVMMMHPAVKALLIVYEIARTVDDVTDGKLRKSGKKLLKNLSNKRGK